MIMDKMNLDINELCVLLFGYDIYIYIYMNVCIYIFIISCCYQIVKMNEKEKKRVREKKLMLKANLQI